MHPVEMDERVHGLIDLNSYPFKILVNAKSLPARQRVTLVHEMLHAICHVYKLNIDHGDLHTLAVQIVTEMLPAFEKIGWLKIN